MLFLIYAIIILVVLFIILIGLIALSPFIVTLYSIPYWWWKGNQPYSEKLENTSIWGEFKNATYVYKCWLTGKKPNFK